MWCSSGKPARADHQPCDEQPLIGGNVYRSATMPADCHPVRFALASSCGQCESPVVRPHSPGGDRGNLWCARRLAKPQWSALRHVWEALGGQHRGDPASAVSGWCDADAGQIAADPPIGGPATELRGRRTECDVLDRLIEAVRAGQSRALMVRGEPGVGKTALLGYVVEQASGCLVARAAGVQSEMELAFAGVHQLCAPMLDHLDRLPGPQRDALRTALGISAGSAPDRFLVALAVLSLLSDAAERRPLICLVDDQQWLDLASTQVLAFVARRLQADSVGLLFAARKPCGDMVGLPELVLEGLCEGDARALLDSVLTGPLDARVRDQIVTETRGNPLALVELARGSTRAWHRAQAAPGPAEDVAEELERSAGRAQARGGLPAAAAFLERSAILTPDPARRAQRLLAAARAKRDVGALDAALGLLVAVEAGPVDAARTAEVEYLRGQVALMQQRGADAARLLLSAARRLGPIDADLARETHLEALGTAIFAGDLENPGGVVDAAKAARAAATGTQPPRLVDVLLDAFALRLTEGYIAAAPTLTRALELALAPSGVDDGRRLWLTGARAGAITALELWDAESAHVLATRLVRDARDSGAVARLQFALNTLAWTHLVAGELTTAELMIDEDRVIAEATGNPALGNARMVLAAWRGDETPASELIEATLREATARGLGRTVDFAAYATAVLNNGLGRHHAARDAARQAFERDQLGYGPFVVPELAEAASRTGDAALVSAALEWLSERTRVTPTDWALGIEARLRALLSEGEDAERFYRKSIARLGRTCVRVELARAHLLYGEWLRRERRRVDARQQLGTAHQMLATMGIEAFAERARRELLATGETVRKRRPETPGELTFQEAQVARFARDGLSNPEIGVRLFISPRTVKYHLRKVFIKLDITSRNQLDSVLPSDPGTLRT